MATPKSINKEQELGTSLSKDAWRRLTKNHLSLISLFLLILIILASFCIPIIGDLTAPDVAVDRATNHWYKDPNYQNLTNTFAPFSPSHYIGTDHLGRDSFARLLRGGQVSILVGIIATLIAVTIGVSYGAIAGYMGGKIDALAMRIVDIFFGLPQLMLIILFSMLIEKSNEQVSGYFINTLGISKEFVYTWLNILPLCVVIGILGWFTMARVVRAQVISIKNLEFIEAARSLGLSNSKILLKHILPNSLGPIIVYTSLTIPTFILIESTLSFLGLGVSAPESTWGILLSENANYIETKPILLLVPAIVFSITLLALNFIGDGLRDALDPKSSKD